MICFKKNWKNQIFSFFFSKSMLTSCLLTRVSQICAKKFKNWVRLCFGNVLKLKVTKGELIISNHVEMADQYLRGWGGGGGGGSRSPLPHWLGLNVTFVPKEWLRNHKAWAHKEIKFIWMRILEDNVYIFFLVSWVHDWKNPFKF